MVALVLGLVLWIRSSHPLKRLGHLERRRKPQRSVLRVRERDNERQEQNQDMMSLYSEQYRHQSAYINGCKHAQRLCFSS